MPKIITYEYIKSFIESKDYQLLSDNYKDAHTKLLLKCPIGHEHKIRFNNFQQGQRCSVCSKEETKKKLKLSFDYVKSFINNNNNTLLSDAYKNNRTKLLLKCPIGHEYKITFKNFKDGQRCSVCNGGIKLSYEYIKNFIESENYSLLSDTYKNNRTKLLLKCPIGHEYKASFGNFKSGKRCPICNAENTSSKGEQDLALYVESLGISIVRNDRSLLVNPLTGKNLELDIYIPSLSKAIEYNGVYWHSIKNNDKIKQYQCKQLGIELLVVNENNWNSNKEIEKKIIESWVKR